jgi:phage/plasmid-like protein (TIGR03299 family)
MAHLVETMAYANSVPWHGLGNQVSDALTPQEMILAAGLDWTVSRRSLFTTQSPADFQASEATLKTDDWGVLVRDSDNKILGPCGKNYVPMQNSEVFAFFDRFVKAGHMKMETAGSLDGGRQVWGLAAINKGFALPGGDEVNGYLLLNQPHVWGKSLTIMFTPIRVVCNNTLTQALGQAGERFTMSHIRQFDQDVIQKAETALGLATHQLDAFKVTAELLARVSYQENKVTEYIAKLFNPALVGGEITRDQFTRSADEVYNCIHTQPGADLSEGSWWSALNAVTFYVDHKAGRNRDAALNSAWFGPRAALKRKALDLAVEYAQAA